MADLLRERYEPIDVLGEGGEGMVLKALDHQHDRLVALKIRTVPRGEDRDALLSEARVLLAIPPHPHVPLVRDDFFDGDRYVIAMDWVEGRDLGRLLHARGRPGLGPSVVLPWLADAASALTHLHGQRQPVVHGDVKPANLVLTDSGRVVLVDFGLSSSPSSPRRRTGTRGYAAPELVAGGEPNRASDVYSLAATAFTLLTGQPPTGVRPAWDGIDPDQAAQLEEAIRLGLATDPAKRPESAGELVERLRAGWHASLPSGVLTFCLTDIVGSTSKWETRPGDMSISLARHDDLVAAAAEHHGGRFLDSQGEGDSTVTMYQEPGNAVSAAIELVNELTATDWPSGLPLAIRVGIHTGETDRRRDDYVGPTLNLAARLRGLGEAGEIMVSRTTAALIDHHLPDGVALVPLGPHRLRGVREPEEVFAVSAPGVRTPPPPTDCPYPGLFSFTAGDSDHFFGREAVVDEIAARLRAHPFLAVVGASGSGKSSVLRAGVAPHLGIDEVITPGAHPLANLDAVDGPVVIDQFEELFTQPVSDGDREAFLERLLAWPHPLAIGLRADFYGACADHAGFADAVARHQVLLGPMSRADLRRAITEPATLAGLKVEPGLVDVLVAKVAGEPGALPLLSHALRSTWEVRDGRTLTLDGYTSTGGVEGAIAATADGAFDALDPADQVLARRLFVRLVEPGEGTTDTRRRAQLSELVPAGSDEHRMDRVLGAVVGARLVTMDETGVEVAHEALIREWPRLKDWLDEDRDSLRLQRHLTAAATAWDQRGHESSELYRGTRLAAALEWLDADPPISALERQFLDESQAGEERDVEEQVRTNRRLRRRLTLTGVALVVALIAGAVALVQGRSATSAQERAEVSRIAADSRSLTERQPALGLLLAAEAYRRRDDADTRSTLLTALETNPLLEGLLYGSEAGLETVSYTPDGEQLATPTSDGTILWDTATREKIDTLTREGELPLAAAVSPDGQWLAVAAVTREGAGNLEVWDLRTRTLEQVVPSPAGVLTSTSFTPDGERLITQGGPSVGGEVPLLAVEWDTTTWEPIGEPWILDETYLRDDVITLSPDGERLAALSPEGDVQVWTVDDRRPLGTRLPRKGGDAANELGFPTAIGFAPDGTLAIASDSSRVVIVDPATGDERTVARLPDGQPTTIAFSHDGSMLAVGNSDGRTQLFDVASMLELGAPLAASSTSTNDVAFSPDDRQLATGSADRTGALWHLDGARAIAEGMTGHARAATQVAYTSDGRYLVSSGSDGMLLIRDLEEGTTRSIEIGGEVLTAAVDPTDRWVAAGGATGRVQLFDIATGRPGPELPLDHHAIHQIAFDPNSGALAAAAEGINGANEEGFVVVWDPERDRELGARIALPGGTPIAVDWSPDGEQIAIVTDNNFVHVRDADGDHAARGRPIESIDAPFLSVAFSPDGARFATGTFSGLVQQWDASTREPIGPALKGHNNLVAGLAYSPDGSLLASSAVGFSRTRLWDTESGTPVGQEMVGGRTPFTYSTFLLDHYQGSRPAFSPDGDELAVPSFDGTIAVWSLDAADWLEAACALVGRDLTRDEWDQYLGRFEYRRTCA